MSKAKQTADALSHLDVFFGVMADGIAEEASAEDFEPNDGHTAERVIVAAWTHLRPMLEELAELPPLERGYAYVGSVLYHLNQKVPTGTVSLQVLHGTTGATFYFRWVWADSQVFQLSHALAETEVLGTLVPAEGLADTISKRWFEQVASR